MTSAILAGFLLLAAATIGAMVGAGLRELARRVRDDERD